MWQGRWSVVIRVAFLTLAVFALYSNIRQALKNYQVNNQIKLADAEIRLKEIRNRKLNSLIYYYNSLEYREVEARRRLDLKMPGEVVIAVKGLQTDVSNNSISEIISEAETPKEEEPVSNYSKWLEYFFR